MECVDTDEDDTDDDDDEEEDEDDEEVPGCTGWTVLLTTATVLPL